MVVVQFLMEKKNPSFVLVSMWVTGEIEVLSCLQLMSQILFGLRGGGNGKKIRERAVVANNIAVLEEIRELSGKNSKSNHCHNN